MIFYRFAQLPVTTLKMRTFNLANDTRDVQNDRINGQLIEILMRLQEFYAPCAAEQSKANSSLLDVCTILKPKLELLGQNISDYVSSR